MHAISLSWPLTIEQLTALDPLFIPIIGAILILIVSVFAKESDAGKYAYGVIATVFIFLTLGSLFIYVLPLVNTYGIIVVYYSTFTPPLGASLEIDMLSWFMMLVFTSLAFFVAIYSISYMKEDSGLDKFYALLLTILFGMNGVVMAGDFFTLFVFWETMAISSYVLVAFRKDKWEAVEAGMKYLLMSAFGSTLVLFTMSLLYGLTGTLNLAYMAIALRSASPTPMLYIIIALLIVGFGVKASIVPLHTWLPDAHPAAPTGISALLSGVVIKTGVYAILRLLLLFFSPLVFINYGIIVAFFAVLTMTVGNLMALLQDDIKRLLAYSSIVNIGYIMAGIAIGMLPVSTETATLGVTGALFHVFNHSMMKGLLFLCSGVYIHAAGSRSLSAMKGLGRRMKVTTFCFAIGALAMIGVPPLSGFYSKFIIIWAAIVANQPFVAALILLNSAFSVAYYLRLLHILVFNVPEGEILMVKEKASSMLVPIVLLMVGIVLIGLFPGLLINWAQSAATAVVSPDSYIQAILDLAG
jgi:multicomponent Na+:H+ antiporter subunit D